LKKCKENERLKKIGTENTKEKKIGCVRRTKETGDKDIEDKKQKRL
jgi:hypothetical protein